PPMSPPFPYTTLFRSYGTRRPDPNIVIGRAWFAKQPIVHHHGPHLDGTRPHDPLLRFRGHLVEIFCTMGMFVIERFGLRHLRHRSEEHTSELQSRGHL